MKRVGSAFAVAVLVVSLIVGLVPMEAEANFVPIPMDCIYIQPDGSVSPSTAPIERVGTDTYVLTGDLNDTRIEVKHDNIVLDGAGYTMRRVNPLAEAKETVLLQDRTNVTVKNMKVSEHQYGIRLNHSSNNVVCGNTLTNTRFGIWISEQSTNNLISENSITGAGDAQKHEYMSSIYRNKGYAISIHNSCGNKFRDNQMTSNYRNFWVNSEGLSSPSDYSNDVDSSNTIDGKPMYYWIDKQDRVVPLDAGYVALVNCKNITVENLNLTYNGQGVLLAFTTNSLVTKNILNNNTFGIELQQSTGNRVVENGIADNDYGISAYSSDNIFRSNSFQVNVDDANFESGFIDDFDASNTIEGTPAYCWINQHDRVVPPDAGYVFLMNCNNITIQGSYVSGKKQGITLISTTNSRVANCSITQNGEGIYLKDASNIQVVGNTIANNIENGICAINSPNNLISSNLVTSNKYNVFLTESNNNVLFGNRLSNSQVGIFLNSSSTAEVTLNEMRNNSWAGINLERSSNCKIAQNQIVENTEWGLVLKEGSAGNSIYGNNFVNNSYRSYAGISGHIEVYNPWPCEPNTWDNGTAGNYWSNYQIRYPNVTEIGTSAIGDTAYEINVNNTDRYPLLNPISIDVPPPPELPDPNASPSTSTSPTYPAEQQAAIAPEIIYIAAAVTIVTVGAISATVVFLKKKK